MHGAAAHLGARPGRAPARPGAEGAPSSRAAGRGPAPGEGGGGGPGRAAPEAEASRPAETREARLLRLREALKEAVSAERFEEAARLRDEIRALEAGGPSSGSGGAGREAKG
ncbi:MAG: UvrB/UvrC motif-containing protein [Clostridia bacterium]|nr:UvrB/UvrC motif-containing protein [Clostridia bacterium]